jgi:carboxypeptidase C (cathepsin A)
MGLLHFRACAGFLILVLEVIFNLGGAWGADLADLVTNLPGQPLVNFKQYAGYVTVNESHGRALFYWFVEADQKDPALLPLAFWFTGGPGCSSIGGGFLQEIGPFFTNANGTGLIRNKHTWNKYANIVFVDSPSGTGYSYSNTTSDYSVFTDQLTAEDNLAFTLGWFAKFPEYKKNKFYLTGESFSGHYLPELAEQIVLYNEKPGLDYKINFKGFAVGNALTDGYSDNLGTIEFYYYHSLISDQTYTTLIQNCNFSVDGPVESVPNPTCDNTVDYAYDVELAEINPYNIYGLNCNPPATTNRPAFIKRVNMIRFAGVNPCPPDTVTPYLNLPAVKAALHARQDIEWTFCSNTVYDNYSTSDFTRSILPFYRFLLTKDLRIWVYSGDVDGIVPTTGTRIWLAKLNLPIETAWYPWNHSSQVGGWSQVYTNLTFTTVRDSGHQVPLYQPGRALQLFKYFLKGQSLPGFDYKN